MIGISSSGTDKKSSNSDGPKVSNKYNHRGFKIPMCIDGKKMKKNVKKIVISRLLKSDGVTQASIPIQTFLPFRPDDLPNKN